MLDSLIHRDTHAGSPKYVASELSYLVDRIVNVVFVGAPGAASGSWALVDAGLPGSADRIKRAAAVLFGAESRPAAIVLTHGHFDHVGAIHTLVRDWDVPVYAHELELPYLTGRSAYPPPEPLVGGGMMAALSFTFPTSPIDLRDRVHALPDDGSVPGMPGWRWIPTPGHAPGHVSFVRDSDRTVIVGDAFTTTKQDSLLAVLSQRPEMHGPPMCFTPDWDAAKRSVQHLAGYSPTAVITGHGPPMRGSRLQEQLHQLASHFDERARPAHGRYKVWPAITNRDGVVDVPPPVVSARTVAIAGVALGAIVALAASRRRETSTALVLADDTPRPALARGSNLGVDVGDVTLREGGRLAIADGGYDITLDSSLSPSLP
jgi:glyoxylase-like metal-dependent hydrolase (beta-lactamase superfamily II)